MPLTSKTVDTLHNLITDGQDLHDLTIVPHKEIMRKRGHSSWLLTVEALGKSALNYTKSIVPDVKAAIDALEAFEKRTSLSEVVVANPVNAHYNSRIVEVFWIQKTSHNLWTKNQLPPIGNCNRGQRWSNDTTFKK